MHKKNI